MLLLTYFICRLTNLPDNCTICLRNVGSLIKLLLSRSSFCSLKLPELHKGPLVAQNWALCDLR